MSTFHLHLHRELQQLFDSFRDAEGTVGEWVKRGYAINHLEHKSILFVGLNPCYTDDEQPKGYEYYRYTAQDEYPRFFKPYKHVANLCQRGDDWAYTDVFYYRELKQEKLWPVLETPEGREFIIQQLRFTLRLIEYLAPDLIVVCHPGAHRFFGLTESSQPDDRWMGYTFEYSPAFGVDQIIELHPDSVQKSTKGTRIGGTPVLFTGELKDMDIFTQKRLAWQMKQVLRFHNLFFTSPRGSGNFLNRQIVSLAMSIMATQKGKRELIYQGHYHIAAQIRVQEMMVREQVLEILIKLAGGEEDQ